MRQPSIARATAFVLGLAAIFIAAVVAIAVALIQERRNEALSEGEKQAVRFISGAEAAINRSLLGVDVLLASTDKLLGLSGSMPEWVDGPAASKLIQSAMRQNLLIRRVALVDMSGKTIASSDTEDPLLDLRLPLSFIDDVLSQPVSTLVMSAPIESFRSSEVVLYMGRHIKLADGSKLLAVAEVPTAQFTSILVQGADIEGLQTTMERRDGELLVAAPLQGPLGAKKLSPALGDLSNTAPSRNMSARLSGEPAVVAVRNTLYGGVLITASIPLSSVLREWVQNSFFIIAVAVALLVMISLAAGLSLWYLNRIHAAQASIANGKLVLDQALESMESAFILVDAQRRVLSWNRRFIALHPWLDGAMAPLVPFIKLVEDTAPHVLPHADAQERAQWITNRMALLNAFHEGRQITTPDGAMLEVTERPTPDGGAVIVYQDVTRLRRAIADVETLAFYDPLTGLPNRRLLNDRLQQGIHTSLRSGRHGALLFLDLDHFKTLNDTGGHELGDLLLQQVAQRLSGSVRDEDTVARLGGDEFVVMLQSLSTDPMEAATQAKKVGETIRAELNKPYTLRGAEYTSSCSMGATLFGTHPQEASDLLKQADIAMYQVKNGGRNALCFFDPEMLKAITARAEMERDLRHAVDAQQLVLHYQAQVRGNNHPMGVEALIRWQHPERGMVPPGQFIGLAEETGLILSIGEWVLRTACRQLKAWEHVPAASGLQIAVNVSARQFRAADFVQQVTGIVRETGIVPQLLKLELTESMVLDNVDDTIEKMQQLKALGVLFSMDDFGTGYSSLSYLTRLPLDQLKIDQSFVRNIGLHASDSAVIDSIIGLARSLGLEVIAEGVETVEQRDFLAEHGCDNCQGYLFARPLPLEEFEAWLIPNRIAI